MISSGLEGNPRYVIPAATSVEIIHRTSLIFHDIQDNGEERNDRLSVQAAWGSSQAINAGLALSCMARLAALRDGGWIRWIRWMSFASWRKRLSTSPMASIST